jgi:glycosyltransferase involved in cell wall biosynthesis
MSNIPQNIPAGTGVGPVISVVVPTFNRRESLCRLLESLTAQTLAQEMYEIIVVSDGSTDQTGEYVRRLQLKSSNLFLFETANRGPGAARNTGARAARGTFLAFTDDDCIADKDWLVQLLSTFSKGGAVGVQGKTTTDRDARSPLTHEVEVLTSWVTILPTCNAGYLRAAFDEVGGFDESYKFQFNEDADLAWRLAEVGTIVFAENVLIRHPPRLESFWKRARWIKLYEADFRLYYKNKAKYRAYISRSPWINIYWSVFVFGQLKLLKSYFRYLFNYPSKPTYFLIGIALTFVRTYYLIRFFPDYYRTYSINRQIFASQASKT